MTKPETCPVCQGHNTTKKLDLKDYFLTQEPFSIWQCMDCSVMFTHPKPETETLSKYYDTPSYLSHNTGQNGFTGKIYSLLRKVNIRHKYKIVTKHISKGNLLDIGCGSGELLIYFQNQGWTGLGIEPNPGARKYAQSHYGLKVRGEEEIGKLENKTFDVITLWHVLEHVPYPNERMKDLRRLLKDEGRLIIALPNTTSWDAAFYKEEWAAYDVPRHLFHFSPEAFQNLADNHGFFIMERLPMKMDAYYVALLSEQYRNKNMPFLRALYRGSISNIKAAKTGNYSSIIYILQKK